MSASRGPQVSHRTVRSRAIDVGTEPGGFAEQGPDYDPVAGTPVDVSGGRAAPAAPTGATPSGAPVAHPSPFKIGQ